MKNKNKGFANLVVLGLVVVLVAIGGYFAVGKKGDNVKLTTYTSKEDCEINTGKKCLFQMCDINCDKDFKNGWVPVGQQNTNVDETVSLKTYTNTEYGFEIKIPQDWTVEKNAGALEFISEVSRVKNSEKVEECKHKSNSGIVPCLMFVIDMRFYPSNYGYTNTKQEVINGVTWTAIGGTYEGLAYQTKHGDSSFHFSVVGFPENKEKLAQILSTFKFTK